MNSSLTNLLLWLLASAMLTAHADERDSRSLRDAADRAAEAVKNWKRDEPDDFHAKRDSHDQERMWLRDELQLELKKLGKRASRHQLEEVVKKFRNDHALRISNEQQAAKEIAEELKVQVPDGAPSEIDEFRREFSRFKSLGKEARADYKQRSEAAASKEERDLLRETFREEQRAYHRDLKDALQRIRTETRNNGNTGDRRVSE